MQHLFDDPYLSESEVLEILEMGPKCPKCGEPARFIYLYTETKHEMWKEVDGSPSETIPMRERLLLNVSEAEYDREEFYPANNDYPKLECENDHEWVETRFVFKDWSLRFRDA